MVIPSAGSVVLVPFPFSDLTQSKLRPAVVLAPADRGGLRVASYARPAKLFTAHESLFVIEVGKLSVASLQKIRGAVASLFL